MEERARERKRGRKGGGGREIASDLTGLKGGTVLWDTTEKKLK